ncbi:hypothetical protein GUJ93_ZPchr0008g13211 [Zizania palustris]|uniref:DUF3741 domain-containing protein n=1 Tax=Zizania palustris TaxID=103762 RepID=A0A8J5RIV9_ZIZPA|nr:hypothetical protein GUJ93_ZPchr0008g13211 [Zizania palustris]KAG8045760.1 hypothetical protein GUJ93_ZPchr0008g13211 [Zizania palustris]
MHQDSFRSVVCRSLSKSLPSKTKERSYPETAQCDVPCVVTLQPTVCRGCQGRDWSPSQSIREERSMLPHKDYLMASSLSRRYAEDLLRGAMDLQDSLAMLQQFQTASSRSMRLPNKKRRPEVCDKSPGITGIRDNLLGASNAKKAVPRSISNGLDGQLRNPSDELKKVIKDSLYKKNTLPVYPNDEQASMSRSSRITPNKSLLSKSSEQKNAVPKMLLSGAPGQPDKSKFPSLVAKLMGLDGFPTQSGNTVKKDEMMKTVSSPRALFDIEMPKAQQTNNAHMNFHNARKGIVSLYDSTVINELGSMRTIQREKGIDKSQTKASKHTKVVSHTRRRQQIKETTEMSRRSSDKQKPHLTCRRGEGRKDTKSNTGTGCRSNATIVKRPGKKSVIASSSSSSTCGTRRPVPRKSPSNSRDKAVPSRSIKNSTIDDIVAYELHREFIQFDGLSTEYSATPSDDGQSTDWDTQPCMDGIRKDLSESYEASLTTSPSERTESTNRDVIHPSTHTISPDVSEIKDEMGLLLLSDQSFLTRAAELVGIGAYRHLINQYKGIPNSKDQMENHKLFVDTAAELLDRKHRQQNSLCYTGSSGQKCRTATYSSLEPLLRDIHNASRKLNSYTDDDGCVTKDTLYMKLEKDLRCTDASINSVWDMGWEDWICMEETQCFLRDIGEGILSMLIEEAALDVWVN